MNTAIARRQPAEERGVKPQEAAPDTPGFGMRVFLTTGILFFGGLFVAYGYGRLHWPTGFGRMSTCSPALPSSWLERLAPSCSPCPISS